MDQARRERIVQPADLWCVPIRNGTLDAHEQKGDRRGWRGRERIDETVLEIGHPEGGRDGGRRLADGQRGKEQRKEELRPHGGQA